ncbi:MAG: EthD family reductase [Anaerolineales bacterium]|nr:EthD family reductase [Anaerolineales bacterium]
MSATYKLIILFKQPEDPADFERRWSEEFVPLTEQLPGLQRVVVAHTHGGPAGPVEIYLVHELHFNSLPALKAAMSCALGIQTGQTLVRLAPKGRATLLFAEHMEDTPTRRDPPKPPAPPPPVPTPPKAALLPKGPRHEPG